MAEEKDLEFEELEEDEPSAPAEGAGEGGDTQGGMDMGGLPDVGDLPRSFKNLEAVYDIPVQVSAVLGKTTMQVSQLLKIVRAVPDYVQQVETISGIKPFSGPLWPFGYVGALRPQKLLSCGKHPCRNAHTVL